MLFDVKVNQKSHGGTKINIHTDHCGTISFDAAQTKVIVKAKGYASLMNGIASLKFKWPWRSDSEKEDLDNHLPSMENSLIGD